MNEFKRECAALSLCGLNCLLCPMFLDGHCPGCGHGNRPCKIAKCAMNQDKIEFCFQCPKYPCPLYKQIDVYDSFITHLHQKQDLNKIQFLGIDQYTALQKEKAEILHHLLAFHNDGRHKTFFCLAVNLLEMDDLRQALCQPDVIESLREAANQKHIVLKLRRKKKSTP